MNYEYEMQQQLFKRREQFYIAIRKADINEAMTQKRVRCSPLSDIDQTDNILEIWYHSLIDNFDVNNTLQDIKNFLNNPDKLEMRLKRFSQYDIYLTILMKLDEISDLNLLDSLLYILSNCHSKTLFSDIELLRRTQTMKKIITFLEHHEFKKLQKHVFFLLGNLIGFDDGRKVQLLINQYNLLNIIVNMWKNQIIYEDLDTVIDFLWFLENFIHYDKNNCSCLSTNELKYLLPIYFVTIKNEFPQIVLPSLRGIRSIITQKDKIIDNIVQEQDILKIMFDRCSDSNQEIQLEAILTTMGLLLGDNVQEQVLLQCGILNLMELIYVRLNQNFKQIIIWGLGNVLTSQRTDTIQKTIHSNVFKRVLDDFHNLQTEKLRSEYMMMLRGFKSIDNEDIIRIIIMQTKLVDVLIDVLSESYDTEQIIQALQIVKNMHYRTQGLQTNLAQEVFEMKGIKKLLDYLSLKDNQEIQYLTLELQEQYYYY